MEDNPMATAPKNEAHDELAAFMAHLADEHGFHSVSVGFNRDCSVGNWWSANVHWKGFSRTAISCAGGHGNDAFSALLKAEKTAAEYRTPYPSPSEKDEAIARLREQLAALEA